MALTVQELFERLSYAELSSLSIGMEGDGEVTDHGRPQIIRHIGVALSALYSRFLHKRSELVLEAMDGVQKYVLDRAHAESDTTPNSVPRYIRDVTLMEEPFQDDLIKILSVRRQNEPKVPGDLLRGRETLFSINARNNDKTSARILTHNSLRLLTAQPGELFHIEYQANHPKLDPHLCEDQGIEIMPSLEEALQARVAASVFSGMTGEIHVAIANGHMARYEKLCEMAALDDLLQESGTDARDRLRDKGFC